MGLKLATFLSTSSSEKPIAHEHTRSANHHLQNQTTMAIVASTKPPNTTSLAVSACECGSNRLPYHIIAALCKMDGAHDHPSSEAYPIQPHHILMVLGGEASFSAGSSSLNAAGGALALMFGNGNTSDGSIIVSGGSG